VAVFARDLLVTLIDLCLISVMQLVGLPQDKQMFLTIIAPERLFGSPRRVARTRRSTKDASLTGSRSPSKDGADDRQATEAPVTSLSTWVS